MLKASLERERQHEEKRETLRQYWGVPVIAQMIS